MNPNHSADWRIGVDIGGTFTDIVLWNATDNTLRSSKLLTTPDDPSQAVIEGIKKILAENNIATSELKAVIHGTTLVANALIERKGVPTGLITTRGFRDVLEIGREWRYDLFNLDIEMPQPLVERRHRYEISERIEASGHVIKPVHLEELDAIAAKLRDNNIGSVAISLLHAYQNSEHERAVQNYLEQQLPIPQMSLSSEVSPQLGEYERTSTTVANAYVQPIFKAYVDRLAQQLQALGFAHELLLILSDGRCVRRDQAIRFPIRLVQSGPAAGAQAAQLFGTISGQRDLLCFDMGGTTAKACLIEDAEPARSSQFEVARETRFAEGSGLPLQIPAIDMIEIGAGGGSIARIDKRGLLQVGPDSASADPGPACYGRGGRNATVTDCDLLLGYLDEHSFLGGSMTLDRAAAEQAISEQLSQPLQLSPEQAAWGVHETVTANMAQAASIHAIERGLDVSRFALVPIGGAGPVHACSMARKMSIDQLICPSGAGVASAIGMLASPVSFEQVRAAPIALSELSWPEVSTIIDELSKTNGNMVTEAGVAESQIDCRISAMMRYIGQGYEVDVPVCREWVDDANTEALADSFAASYQKRFGRTENMAAELIAWRVVASGPKPALADAVRSQFDLTSNGTHRAAESHRRRVYFGNETGFVDTPVYKRASLKANSQIEGPAIIEETESTLVLPPDFSCQVDAALNILITHFSES